MPQEVYCGFQVTGDDRMGQKSKPKKIPRASNKTSENPTLGWVLDPDVLKWKNRGLWTVCLGKMRQRVDRRQPFFLRLSWLGNGSKKEDTKVLNRSAKLKTLMIMPQTFFFCPVQLCDFLSQWDLVCDRRHLKAMTQSVYMGGLLVGSVVFSTLSDHFGRKVAVFLSILIMVSIARIVFEMRLFELRSVIEYLEPMPANSWRSFCLTSEFGEQSLRPWELCGGNQNFHPYDEIKLILDEV